MRAPELLALADLAAPIERPARDGPVLVDLRTRSAFRRAHLRGSISIPQSRLFDSLFLLPPRRRRLVLISTRPERSRQTALELARRGWKSVDYLGETPRSADPGWFETGDAFNRTWEPSSFLARVEPELPRRSRICDLACGSGRNAVFLALKGHAVVGVDLLPDALRQARRLVRESGVAASSSSSVPDDEGRVSFRRLDLTEEDSVRRLLRAGRFDVFTCFRYLDRNLLPRLRAAIPPGGHLIYETFLEEQRRRHGKPSSPGHLLRPGELREAFAELEVLSYAEGPDEGDSWLASLLARGSSDSSEGSATSAKTV